MNTSISLYLLNTTFTYKNRRVNMCECVKTYKPNMAMNFQREKMTFNLNLPPIRSNPFSSRPIESYDWNLLAGRGKLVGKLVRHLKFDSPRLVLLKGERGSGRTSLIHAVASQASRFDSLTIFPHNDHSRRILDETYTSIVGFDIPQHHGQLVSQLVEEMDSMSGTLPLIAYDFPGASGSDIVAVFSRLIPVLQRLRALVIITVTPSQLAAFSEDLRESFDDLEELSPLSTTEIEDLVRRRIDSVSRRPWEMPENLTKSLKDETGGHCGRIIRTLREIVDVERGEKVIDQRLKNLRAAMEFQQEEESGEEEPIDEENFTIEQAIEGIKSKEDLPEEIVENEDESEVRSRISEILDDSNETNETFSLTMDRIDEEVQEETMYLDSDMPPITGMFGGLAQRNRVAKSILPPRFDPEINPLPDYAVNTTPPTMTKDGAELWIENSEGSEELETLPEVVGRIDHSVDMQEANFTESFSPEDSIGKPAEKSEFKSHDNQFTPMEKVLQSSHSSLVNRLSALRKTADTTPHNSVPINISHLRSISEHELQIIARSAIGELSPSDEDILISLRIGRSRMSQICNGLYRSGILRVRKIGRSRMYSLTNDARVQLQVWGMLE